MPIRSRACMQTQGYGYMYRTLCIVVSICAFVQCDQGNSFNKY